MAGERGASEKKRFSDYRKSSLQERELAAFLRIMTVKETPQHPRE